MGEIIRVKKEKGLVPIGLIQNRIIIMRGEKVMLDRDLAKLYGIETKQLKRAVRRNGGRFPPDFMFELTSEEHDGLRCQIGTLKTRRTFQISADGFHRTRGGHVVIGAQ